MNFNNFQIAYTTALANLETAKEKIKYELACNDAYKHLKTQENFSIANPNDPNFNEAEFEKILQERMDIEIEVEKKFKQWELQSILRDAEKALVYAFKEAVIKPEMATQPKYIAVVEMMQNVDKIMMNLKFRQQLIDIAMKFKWEL